MSEHPPYPPNDPQQPGWGTPPPPGWQPPGGGGWQPPGPPGYGGQGYGGLPDPNSYQPTQAIGYGWKAFQAYVGPLLGAAALALIVPALIQLVGSATGSGEIISASWTNDDGFDFDFNPMAVVFNIVATVTSLVLAAGVIRMAFDVVDGHEPSFATMFSRFDVIQVVIAAIVVGVLTSIGLLLCIIPGIIVLFLSYLTNYFIVGKGEDAITAIKSSISLVSNNVGSMLLLALLSICVMVLGLIACLVGTLVAYPVVTVAAAFTFRYLQREPIRPLS